MRARIALHRQRRPHQWLVAEEALELAKAVASIADTHLILLDSITAWVSNWMERWAQEQGGKNGREECLRTIGEEADKWLAMLEKREAVMVTDEVGLGGVAMHPVTRLFQDALGLVNQKAAKQADEVWMVISGIPWKVKG
jgi:adenosylcobinamide kinase/adenosylcobinamide-phosphate guanylyltransferase